MEVAIAHVAEVMFNDGTGNFRDDSSNALAIAAVETISCPLADLDGDGDLDVLVVMENPRTLDEIFKIHVNQGVGFYVVETGSELGITRGSGRTHSLAFGDIDGDGDVGRRATLHTLASCHDALRDDVLVPSLALHTCARRWICSSTGRYIATMAQGASS